MRKRSLSFYGETEEEFIEEYDKERRMSRRGRVDMRRRRRTYDDIEDDQEQTNDYIEDPQLANRKRFTTINIKGKNRKSFAYDDLELEDLGVNSTYQITLLDKGDAENNEEERQILDKIKKINSSLQQKNKENIVNCITDCSKNIFESFTKKHKKIRNLFTNKIQNYCSPHRKSIEDSGSEGSGNIKNIDDLDSDLSDSDYDAILKKKIYTPEVGLKKLSLNKKKILNGLMPLNDQPDEETPDQLDDDVNKIKQNNKENNNSKNDKENDNNNDTNILNKNAQKNALEMINLNINNLKINDKNNDNNNNNNNNYNNNININDNINKNNNNNNINNNVSNFSSSSNTKLNIKRDYSLTNIEDIFDKSYLDKSNNDISLNKKQSTNIKKLIIKDDFLSKNVEIVDDQMKFLIMGIDKDSNHFFLKNCLCQRKDSDISDDESIHIKKKIIKLLGHYLKLIFFEEDCSLGYKGMLSIYHKMTNGLIMIIKYGLKDSAKYAYDTFLKLKDKFKIDKRYTVSCVCFLDNYNDINDKTNGVFNLSKEIIEKIRTEFNINTTFVTYDDTAKLTNILNKVLSITYLKKETRHKKKKIKKDNILNETMTEMNESDSL